MKNMWELKQSVDGVLELYIYDYVQGDSYTWWGDEIRSETSAKHFRDELAAHKNVSEIRVYINSGGGSVMEGTAIYNQLRRHPARKVVQIDGFACSIASVIAMAGDEVVMPRNAMMMIHNMSWCAAGTAPELRKAADDLDIINEAGRQAYLSRAGDRLAEAQLAEMMDAETWLTAEQCIRYGFADRYAEEDADMTQAREILEKANIGIQQRIGIQKSLAAQLREMVAPEPPEPEKKTENKIIEMFT